MVILKAAILLAAYKDTWESVNTYGSFRHNCKRYTVILLTSAKREYLYGLGKIVGLWQCHTFVEAQG